jgi:hypothetical protein
MRFVSLDGVDWHDPAQKETLYVGNAIDVQPTITVRPGWPVRVIVAKDLVLKPYREAHAGRRK